MTRILKCCKQEEDFTLLVEKDEEMASCLRNAILIAVAVLFILAATISGFPVENDASLLISVNPERQQLVDSLGRERFFHGTNVVVKHFPFHPTLEGYTNDSFSEVDMKILQDLGLNVIRLGMAMGC